MNSRFANCLFSSSSYPSLKDTVVSTERDRILDKMDQGSCMSRRPYVSVSKEATHLVSASPLCSGALLWGFFRFFFFYLLLGS